jgi:hypothetical protein
MILHITIIFIQGVHVVGDNWEISRDKATRPEQAQVFCSFTDDYQQNIIDEPWQRGTSRNSIQTSPVCG